MVLIEELEEIARQTLATNGRPLVTLCFAQSLDGSISTRRGTPLALSGVESYTFVHGLRAAHETILVGIGTVLADDPQLNVRLVAGRHPQPVILDTRLRFPLNAKLLHRPGPPPWIITGEKIDDKKCQTLELTGAKIIRMPTDEHNRLILPAILQKLVDLDVSSILVEGGARVITSFLTERLPDYLVLTIAPVFVGGFRSVQYPLFPNRNQPPPRDTQGLPRLEKAEYLQFGDDLVIVGKLA